MGARGARVTKVARAERARAAGTARRGPSGAGGRAATVERFEKSYGFTFDPFQRRACAALEAGSSVLVAAPTGAGKTVVGEFAAWLALERGGKTFYTTPIKALSNQKYGDFSAAHGAGNVGLLTGDNVLNGDAPIVVMTTEVLRNMIYEDSVALEGLRYVVLDEVHYLQDPYRGAVWEEVLIHLPVEVQTASLSATVSNAEEFAEWQQTLRGHVEVIIEEQRPVEIRHWYFASDELLPMFVRTVRGELLPNPRARELERRRRHSARLEAGRRPHRGRGRTTEKRAHTPLRTDVVERLRGEGMLPAIYFIFSRKGCDQAVKQCLRENLRLTTSEEQRVINGAAESRVADLGRAELDVLGYDEWLAGLLSGISSHHAGLIPPFKETVEELFSRGLVKVVFATETLALGINMPARSVVVESLTKFTGEKHELMTPGEYTQLSGRAGRRGIDELGHSVVLRQRFTPFETITRLASTRTYPLQSSFQPSYNMAVNLVRNYERADAEHLVNSSFAQFQADRDVVHLEQRKESHDAYLASYRERMACDLGDIEAYRALVRRANALEFRSAVPSGKTAALVDAIASLRPGDVIDIEAGKRRGRYAVLEVTQRATERRPRVLALSQERSMVRLAPSDFKTAPRPVARLSLPHGFHLRDARSRRHLARRLNDVETNHQPDPRSGAARHSKELRAALDAVESHPCHKCPELGRHLHFAERATRLEREIAGIDRRISRRTATLARRFSSVLEVLEQRAYVVDWALTPKGETLTGVYNEADLLVVEALQEGVLEGLDAPEVAALLSALVYEARGRDVEVGAGMPTDASHRAWLSLLRLWRVIKRDEDARGLELTREPDPGFAETAYAWAAGAELEDVLDEDDSAGDFVRSLKQLVDLLRQIQEVAASEELRALVRSTIARVHRGIVAYSALEL
jgi:ATP-dependent RNA helicase HelY